MTDAEANATTPRAPTVPAPAGAGVASIAAPEEWKPEARQWSWKDLFTAPMLAFKPKCMVISAITLTVIAAWMWALPNVEMTFDLHSPVLLSFLGWLWTTIGVVLFSFGATLVAIFLKADLLDDEFLSFSEALQQFKGRIIPAVLVPLFLMSLYGCVYLILVYLPVLVSHTPYVGATCYAVFYPILYLLSLFTTLLGIAIWLSIFVFPSIISIRKHGWFDNVVDTIEAVGTKPHVLAASLALTLIMVFFAYRIGLQGINQLKEQYRVMPDVGMSVQTTESHAYEFGSFKLLENFDHYILDKADEHQLRGTFSRYYLWEGNLAFVPRSYSDDPSWYKDVTGPITGVWQTIIEAAILGYVLNLFISGGMLTYLIVREDDYWDDENLEDLDQLAKELEEEAKRDSGVPAATAPVAAAPTPKPESPPQPTPPSTGPVS
jgi:hypothetical protein